MSDDLEIINDGKYGAIRCLTLEDFLNGSPNSPRSNEVQMRTQEQKRLYLALMEQPEFNLMTATEQGAEVGVDYVTIQKWKRMVPAEIMQEKLKKSREGYATMSLEVDAALFKESVKDGGDAKHKELYYKRAENWTPAQSLELSRGKDKETREIPTVELVKGLLGTLTPEQKKELLASEGGSGDPGASGA